MAASNHFSDQTAIGECARNSLGSPLRSKSRVRDRRVDLECNAQLEVSTGHALADYPIGVRSAIATIGLTFSLGMIPTHSTAAPSTPTTSAFAKFEPKTEQSPVTSSATPQRQSAASIPIHARPPIPGIGYPPQPNLNEILMAAAALQSGMLPHPNIYGQHYAGLGLPPYHPSVAPPLPGQPPLSVAKDAPNMAHLKSEDRDSGRDSWSLSPPLSSDSSRSPSHHSRSNSFSMTSLLRPADLASLAAAIPGALGMPTTPMTPVASTSAQSPATPHHLHLQHAFGSPMISNPYQINQHFQQLQLEQYRRGQLNPHHANLLPHGGPGREMCEICNDTASGYHYGVMSCEGCKGFFRRTVQKNMEYKCHRDKACKVDRVTRNRCQSCRFQKCLQQGMTRESVRLDKTRKRKAGDDEKTAESNRIMENVSRIEEIHRGYVNAFPEQHRLTSEEDLKQRLLQFLKSIPNFAIQVNELDTVAIVNQCARGIAILRAACVPENRALLSDVDFKLADSIRNEFSQAKIHEFALLSAIYCAMGMHAGTNQVYEQLNECLMTQLATRNAADKNQVFGNMIFKLKEIERTSPQNV